MGELKCHYSAVLTDQLLRRIVASMIRGENPASATATLRVLDALGLTSNRLPPFTLYRIAMFPAVSQHGR